MRATCSAHVILLDYVRQYR